MTIIQVALRSISTYIMLLVLARMIGRKLISRITFFDFIVGVTLGSLAVRISLGAEESPFLAAISAAIFTLLVIITDYLDIKSISFRKIIDGEPIVLISEGKLLDYNLKKVRITINKLMAQLREKDVFNIDDVALASLESDGELTVLLKVNKQPITTGDLNISKKYNALISDIIIDGKIIQGNLKSTNHDEKWVREQLKAHNVYDVVEVFYAGLDSGGNLYVSPKMKQ